MKIFETDWKWKSALQARAYTQYIVLHHAAAKTCTAADVDAWHKANGWSGIGYHYFVRKNGEIYRGRPEWSIGAHAYGKNNLSIGICAEGDYDKETSMPAAQKAAIAELIENIRTRYRAAAVVGHKEIGASSCPGRYYPLKWFCDGEYNKTEDLTMTQYEELKNDIAAIQADLANKTGYYNYIDSNMPESYRPTIEKLVGKSYLRGNERGELMLTTDMMRILTILDRTGVFG